MVVLANQLLSIFGDVPLPEGLVSCHSVVFLWEITAERSYSVEEGKES